MGRILLNASSAALGAYMNQDGENSQVTNAELNELRQQFEDLLHGDALDADQKNALSEQILKIIYCDTEGSQQ